MLERNKAMPGRFTWWLLAAVASAIALAWSGVLDTLSTDYLDGALIGSGAIYATARGINALVSVLQGTEMNAFVITFTIGELLDPVNDLIERFSGVMLVALGSLAMQKILLEVVSHATFNYLLTALGVATLLASLRDNPRLYRALARFFFVTVLVRFSLALAVLANSWADAIFLEQNEARQHELMRGFENELEQIGSRAGLGTDLTGDIAMVQEAIARNRQTQRAEQQELGLHREQLERAEKQLEAIDNRNVIDRLMGNSTATIQAGQQDIAELEAAVESNEYTLAALVESAEALQDRLDCLERRARGESCTLADSMVRALAGVDVRNRIEALGEQVDAFTANLINLLMSLVLKSILLPILFLYLLLRLARTVWAGGQ